MSKYHQEQSLEQVYYVLIVFIVDVRTSYRSSYHHIVKVSSRAITESILLRTYRLYYGCWEGFSVAVALAPAHISIITMITMIIYHNHGDEDFGCENEKNMHH